MIVSKFLCGAATTVQQFPFCALWGVQEGLGGDFHHVGFCALEVFLPCPAVPDLQPNRVRKISEGVCQSPL